MPEQGEFQAQLRPLPAGLCLSGCFSCSQRAAWEGGWPPWSEEDGRQQQLEPAQATSSVQAVLELPGPREAPDRPRSPGAQRPTQQAPPQDHPSPLLEAAGRHTSYSRNCLLCPVVSTDEVVWGGGENVSLRSAGPSSTPTAPLTEGKEFLCAAMSLAIKSG